MKVQGNQATVYVRCTVIEKQAAQYRCHE